MFVVFVYDVKQERVGKVLKICRKYLTHVQNSVFEGNITPAKLRILKDELKEVLDEHYDSVVIYKFRFPAEEREILGVEPPSSEDIFF